MDREKLGNAISVFVSTFLTVYVALQIGKAIGKRETIMEILANDIDRWREMMYPETGEPEIPDEVRAETIEDVIRLRREGQRPSEGVTLQPGESMTIPLGIRLATDKPTPTPRWWERHVRINGLDVAMILAAGIGVGFVVGGTIIALL